MWLCLPGREDACARSLDATEITAAGTNVVRDRDAPSKDAIDCFYVYPTVDLSLAPANHTDFRDLHPMSEAAIAQAARFRSACTLYVPLYRQITIGVYLRKPSEKQPYTDVAVSDVLSAFDHYVRTWNHGRKIVLLGHSQGGEMIVELLKRRFDEDAKLRKQLLVAMPIGWAMEVPRGKATGGTFQNLPVCTKPGETGCVVGYRSHVAGTKVAPNARHLPQAGNETVCVNPAELAHGTTKFSRSFFLVRDKFRGFFHVPEITTPFVMARELYEGRCVDGENGYRYLAIDVVPGDSRTPPLDLENRWLHGELGLHVLDYQFPQGDLVDLVAALGH